MAKLSSADISVALSLVADKFEKGLQDAEKAIRDFQSDAASINRSMQSDERDHISAIQDMRRRARDNEKTAHKNHLKKIQEYEGLSKSQRDKLSDEEEKGYRQSLNYMEDQFRQSVRDRERSYKDYLNDMKKGNDVYFVKFKEDLGKVETTVQRSYGKLKQENSDYVAATTRALEFQENRFEQSEKNKTALLKKQQRLRAIAASDTGTILGAVGRGGVSSTEAQEFAGRKTGSRGTALSVLAGMGAAKILRPSQLSPDAKEALGEKIRGLAAAEALKIESALDKAEDSSQEIKRQLDKAALHLRRANQGFRPGSLGERAVGQGSWSRTIWEGGGQHPRPLWLQPKPKAAAFGSTSALKGSAIFGEAAFGFDRAKGFKDMSSTLPDWEDKYVTPRERKKIKDRQKARVAEQKKTNAKILAAMRKFWAERERQVKEFAKKRKAILRGGMGMARGAAGTALSGAGIAAMGIGVGTAAATSSAVREGLDFESQISAIRAVVQRGQSPEKLAEEMALIENKAREMGRTTAFTAVQAAEGMAELARAGLEAGDVIKAIEPSLHLAGATNYDLARTTGVVVAAMKQFSLNGDHAIRIANIFADANRNSLLTMPALAEAMKYAGTIGSGFGRSLEETTAAVAAFRNLGLEGSLAGTNFRMAMQQATKSTRKKTEVLDRLGLSYDDINPKYNSFADILEKVGAAGAGVEEGMIIFSTRAGGNIAKLAKDAHEIKMALEEINKLELEDPGSQALKTKRDEYKKLVEGMTEVRDMTKQMTLSGLGLARATREEIEAAEAQGGLKEFIGKDLAKVKDLRNKDGKEGVAFLYKVGDEMMEVVRLQTSAAEEMYDTALDNLKGDVTFVTSALSDLKITLFEIIKGPLRELLYPRDGGRGLKHIIDDVAKDLIKRSGEITDKLNGYRERFLGSLEDGADRFVDSFLAVLDLLVTVGDEAFRIFVALGPTIEQASKDLRGLIDEVVELIEWIGGDDGLESGLLSLYETLKVVFKTVIIMKFITALGKILTAWQLLGTGAGTLFGGPVMAVFAALTFTLNKFLSEYRRKVEEAYEIAQDPRKALKSKQAEADYLGRTANVYAELMGVSGDDAERTTALTQGLISAAKEAVRTGVDQTFEGQAITADEGKSILGALDQLPSAVRSLADKTDVGDEGTVGYMGVVAAANEFLETTAPDLFNWMMKKQAEKEGITLQERKDRYEQAMTQASYGQTTFQTTEDLNKSVMSGLDESGQAGIRLIARSLAAALPGSVKDAEAYYEAIVESGALFLSTNNSMSKTIKALDDYSLRVEDLDFEDIQNETNLLHNLFAALTKPTEDANKATKKKTDADKEAAKAAEKIAKRYATIGKTLQAGVIQTRQGLAEANREFSDNLHLASLRDKAKSMGLDVTGDLWQRQLVGGVGGDETTRRMLGFENPMQKRLDDARKTLTTYRRNVEIASQDGKQSAEQIEKDRKQIEKQEQLIESLVKLGRAFEEESMRVAAENTLLEMARGIEEASEPFATEIREVQEQLAEARVSFLELGDSAFLLSKKFLGIERDLEKEERKLKFKQGMEKGLGGIIAEQIKGGRIGDFGREARGRIGGLLGAGRDRIGRAAGMFRALYMSPERRMRREARLASRGENLPEIMGGLVGSAKRNGKIGRGVGRFAAGASQKALGAFGISGGFMGMFQMALEKGGDKLIKEAVTGLIKGLQGFAGNFSSMVTMILSMLPQLVTTLVNSLPGIVTTLITEIPKLVGQLLDAVPGLIDAVVGMIPALFEAIPTLVSTILSKLPEIISSLLNAAVVIIKSLADILPDLIEGIFAALPEIITAVVEAIPEIVVALIEMIPAIIVAIIKAIPQIVKIFATLIPQLVLMFIQLIPEIIGALIRGIPEVIAAVWDALVNKLLSGEFWKEIGERLKAIWDNFLYEWSGGKFGEDYGSIPRAYNPQTGQWEEAQEGNKWWQMKKAIQDSIDGVHHSGTPYIPRTGLNLLEKGEAVLPADSNPWNPSAKGAKMPTSGGVPTDISLTVNADGQLLESVLVKANRKGKATEIYRAMRKGSGVALGFDRGRFATKSR